MLKIRFFLNEPNGKPWKHFKKMMPRLGKKYNTSDIEIDIISKPKADYNTDEYFELDLPVAPAVMVGEEIVVEGTDVNEEKLETIICEKLGLPSPNHDHQGLWNRLFRKWDFLFINLKIKIRSLNSWVMRGLFMPS